jgi:hypothetical protein
MKPTRPPVRATYHHEGELSAAIELRRRFPGITNNENARLCARSIAGWTPLVERSTAMPRRRARKLG